MRVNRAARAPADPPGAAGGQLASTGLVAHARLVVRQHPPVRSEPPFHVVARRQASRLRTSAREEVPDLQGLNEAMDELIRVHAEAQKAGPPADPSPGWGHNSNAVLTAGAMALRTGQAIELLVRSGYAIETAGLVRKLGEITQHAASAAQDPSGDYARNWGAGAGSAGKASKAYERGVADRDGARRKWSALSQQDHANFKPFVNFACWQNEAGQIVFPVLARRHDALDAQAPTSAAWDLARVAAAVCMVYPDVEQGGTLAMASRLQDKHEDADRRMREWAMNRLREWGVEVDDDEA